MTNHLATPKFFPIGSILYWLFVASCWTAVGVVLACISIGETGCYHVETREAFVPVFEGGYPVEDEFGQQSVMVKRTVWKVCDDQEN